MKVETRKIKGNPPRLILITESDAESRMLDEVFGDKVRDDGFISQVSGQVKLADGYCEHYISIQKSG